MDEKIKVTDKRMFTADGELRREREESDVGEAAAADRAESKRAEQAKEKQPQDVESRERSTIVPPGEPAGKGPSLGDELPTPSFLDLVGLLAQPVAMFLGDAELPGGETEENLPLARYHIDLLELLETKTKGNVSPHEAKLVEDLLYQLRMRYVEKAG